MTMQDHGPWNAYACEQAAIRRRECYEQTDVSGREAIDSVLDAISSSTECDRNQARRCSLTSARRERARASLRARYAPSIEADIIYRRGLDAEVTALLAQTLLKLPERTARVFVLQAQGYADHEIAIQVGLSASAVRQRLSRLGRRFAA